jgi:hypothetical protein
MGLIQEIKALFEKNEAEITDVKFVDVKSADGKILRVQDMAVGSTIVEINEDGEVAVEDGTYTLEDGVTLVVEGGLIAEIGEAEVVEEMANVMRTDGVAIYYEGTELVLGETKLFLDEAMTEPAPDGEHLLEGGIKVTVLDGVLTEMVEVEEEEVEVEETFMDITLKDGPIAHIVTAMEGEIKAGDKMMLDGTEAGPGEYFTNDQKVIVVGEFGVIESVSEVAPEQTAEEKEVQGVVNNLKELINQVKELKSQFESEIGEIKKENGELKERVAKFAGEPSAEPTKTTVTLKGQSKEEKLKFFGKR